MAPIARVAAPPVRPPRFSLVASAGAGSGERWETGFKWDGVLCASGGGVLDVCDPANISFDLTDWSCADREFTPYVVFEPVAMSNFRTAEEAKAEAEKQLARYESIRIEEEFWAGTWAIASSTDNAYLDDGNAEVIGGGTLPLFQGLAVVQNELAQRGLQGFIHMPLYALSVIQLNAPGALVIEGNKILDVFGNVIVPGAGYPFSDASTETATFYATGETEVRLGPGDAIEAIDQTNNTKYAVAYRVAAATFDPCVQLEVVVDLCNINCTA